MVDYHDTEWGVPLHDDQMLLEYLILDGAQAGLSWLTILRKREGYRRAFDDFDPRPIAAYGEAKVASLLLDWPPPTMATRSLKPKSTLVRPPVSNPDPLAVMKPAL